MAPPFPRTWCRAPSPSAAPRPELSPILSSTKMGTESRFVPGGKARWASPALVAGAESAGSKLVYKLAVNRRSPCLSRSLPLVATLSPAGPGRFERRAQCALWLAANGPRSTRCSAPSAPVQSGSTAPRSIPMMAGPGCDLKQAGLIGVTDTGRPCCSYSAAVAVGSPRSNHAHKRAVNREVASSIIPIRYNFSPRPSSQSCSLVSHCTSSP